MNSASVTDIFGTIVNNNRSRQVFGGADCVPDSVVVVSQGSAPSLDAIINEDIDEKDDRSNFLRRVTRSTAKGGHEEAIVHVYDEVRCDPK